METLVVKIKSERAARALADFLKTIEYVEQVEQTPGASADPVLVQGNISRGSYATDEKPSDFAGIWANRKKIDAKKLRQQAWQRKK